MSRRKQELKRLRRALFPAEAAACSAWALARGFLRLPHEGVLKMYREAVGAPDPARVAELARLPHDELLRRYQEAAR